MSGCRLTLIAGVLCLLAPLAYKVPLRGAAPQTGNGGGQKAPAASAAAPRAVLDQYCIACHNQGVNTAGLALDALDLANAGSDAEVWEKVVRKMRTGAMPPAGMPRPDKTLAAGVVSWLETELDRAALERPNPGRPSLHRLNRAEYRNAIRDLLALDIDAASLLPADNAAYGFDNNADALSLSAALTERYLEAAARISQMALGRVRGSPAPETIFVPTDRNQGIRFSDDLPWGSRGGMAFRYYFPVDGEYEFEIRPKEGGAGGGYRVAAGDQIDVSVDDHLVWTKTLGPEFGRRRRGENRELDEARDVDRDKMILQALRFRVPLKAGPHLVQAYLVAKTAAFVEDLFDPDLRREPYRARGLTDISSVTITMPSGTMPSVEAAAEEIESPSRRRLLACRPETAADEESCAQRIIEALARRAYRRPVTGEDLRVPLALYREGARQGGFEAGVELAVRSVLVSPKFLFRVEDQPEAVAPNTPYRITDLELASRLSFFLWSSIPDDELLDVAANGTLHNRAVLDRQIARMLADPRSQALVNNFAGQWLHIRNVAAFRPSPEVLFHFDDNLRKAFERETELFFESIIRENRSVLDLLDADYTFLNERLARHYGIPGVYGERFRRVALPADSVRRGLLGQGSILAGTSRPNRTSPVIRGKWILENIFGTPPPPPPPNVPELEEERDPRKVLPMREQMAQHRANPVCASCHAQMDQLGFALENFDAIGEWRDSYSSGAPIDAAAELPDGTLFNGPAELRQVLLNHSDEFLTTITEKLLTYALGRGLEAADAPAVRRIKRQAASADYRFASLIEGIVTSTPFQMRMAQEREVTAATEENVE
jgi:mono/diheme cytochrome c family protein